MQLLRMWACLLCASAQFSNETAAGPEEGGLHDVVWLISLAAMFFVVVLGIYFFGLRQEKSSHKKTWQLKHVEDAQGVMKRVIQNHSMEYQAVRARMRGIPEVINRACGVGIEWSKIECRVKGEDCSVLKLSKGEVRAGKLMAIMGPSGCGKSMLMETIAGKRKTDSLWEVDEDVQFTDGPNSVDRESVKPMMGYVPQDDVVHEFLTVRENIYFSAAKRMPLRTKAHLDEVTNDVLQLIQLVHVQNCVVGNRIQSGSGLSGGQKKRVNVGLELAACPRLLFLDEPTSSLDSPSALELVQNLKTLANLGVTVVMVIHQPRYDLFTLLDDVLLLSAGRVAYCGPTCRAKGHFNQIGFATPANTNPADWMIDILSGQHLAQSAPRRFGGTAAPGAPDYVVEEWERTGCPQGQPGPEMPAVAQLDAIRNETLVNKLWEHWSSFLGRQLEADMPSFKLVLESLLPEEDVSDESVNVIIKSAMGRPGKITRVGFMNLVLEWQDSRFYAEEPPESGLWTPDEWTSSSELSLLSESSSDPEAACCGGPIFHIRGLDAGTNRSKGSNGKAESPGFFKHLLCTLQVSMLQLDRARRTELGFLLIVFCVGAGVSILSTYVFHDPAWSPNAILNLQIAQAFLISIYSLRVFSDGREMYWREASHGLNRVAYFLGRALVNDLGLCLQTSAYVGACYIIIYPPIPFLLYIWPFVLLSYVACGWGFAVSCCLSRSMGAFTCSIIAFVTGGILGMPLQMTIYLDGGMSELLVGSVSYIRWSVDMTFQLFLACSPPDESKLSAMDVYQLDAFRRAYGQARFILSGDTVQWWTGVFALLLQGLVLRFVAYLGLRFRDKARQV